MTIKEKIYKWIDENEQKYIDKLQKIVQHNSTQGNEKAVQELIASYLHELGLEVDMWDLNSERLKKHPYFYSKSRTVST